MAEIRRKRKYIPETEIETQCDSDDDIFEKNSQTYSEDWEQSAHLKSKENTEIETQDWELFNELGTGNTSTCKKKVMVDRATCTEKVTVDVTTCVEKNMVDSAKCIDNDDESQAPTVLDIHGCKYFGRLVANELLRFKPNDRNIKMQKILDIVREQF